MDDPLYRSVEPIRALRPYVRRFMIADCADPVDVVTRPGPTGYNYLSWHFSGSMTANIDGVVTEVPKDILFIAGQIRFQDIEIRSSGHFGHVVAKFQPAGLYELLHLSPAEFCGAARPLPPSAARWLERVFNSPGGAGSQIPARFDSVLGDLVGNARAAPEGVKTALEMIHARGGVLRIKDLAKDVGMSAEPQPAVRGRGRGHAEILRPRGSAQPRRGGRQQRRSRVSDRARARDGLLRSAPFQPLDPPVHIGQPAIVPGQWRQGVFRISRPTAAVTARVG